MKTDTTKIRLIKDLSFITPGKECRKGGEFMARPASPRASSLFEGNREIKLRIVFGGRSVFLFEDEYEVILSEAT